MVKSVKNRRRSQKGGNNYIIPYNTSTGTPMDPLDPASIMSSRNVNIVVGGSNKMGRSNAQKKETKKP